MAHCKNCNGLGYIRIETTIKWGAGEINTYTPRKEICRVCDGDGLAYVEPAQALFKIFFTDGSWAFYSPHRHTGPSNTHNFAIQPPSTFCG